MSAATVGAARCSPSGGEPSRRAIEVDPEYVGPRYEFSGFVPLTRIRMPG